MAFCPVTVDGAHAVYCSECSTHVLVVLLLVAATSSKKPKTPSFQIESG